MEGYKRKEIVGTGVKKGGYKGMEGYKRKGGRGGGVEPGEYGCRGGRGVGWKLVKTGVGRPWGWVEAGEDGR